MNALIDLVARRAGLTPTQAGAAVAAVLDYLAAGLPSPVVGRIHTLLDSGAPLPAVQNGADPPTDPYLRPRTPP